MVIYRRFINSLKSVDLFERPAPETLKGVRNSHPRRLVGSSALLWMSLAILLVISILRCSTPDFRQQLSVDYRVDRMIRILLDLEINLPCSVIKLDYQNILESKALEHSESIVIHRLHADSTPLNSTELAAVRVTHAETDSARSARMHTRLQNNGTCGDCYGAAPADECCDTCADVMYAYRLKYWALPRHELIAQCKDVSGNSFGEISRLGKTYSVPVGTVLDMGNLKMSPSISEYLSNIDLKSDLGLRGPNMRRLFELPSSLYEVSDVGTENLLRKERSEHCRLEGFVDVPAVPASVQINTHSMSDSVMRRVMGPNGSLVTHKLKKLEVRDADDTDDFFMPICIEPFDSPPGHSYQYHMSIVPVTRADGVQTYQCSANVIDVNESNLDFGPSINFRYEVEPIKVDYVDTSRNVVKEFVKAFLATVSFSNFILSLI